MEWTITREYTFIMAPNTAQELWIMIPGRYTHATHVFTPPQGYIHTSHLRIGMRYHPSFGQRTIHSPLQQMSSHCAISQ